MPLFRQPLFLSLIRFAFFFLSCLSFFLFLCFFFFFFTFFFFFFLCFFFFFFFFFPCFFLSFITSPSQFYNSQSPQIAKTKTREIIQQELAVAGQTFLPQDIGYFFQNLGYANYSVCPSLPLSFTSSVFFSRSSLTSVFRDCRE